jgi:hypothetical protein
VLCQRVGDQSCVARTVAILSRLGGGDTAMPTTPPDELPGERDYRDIYNGGTGDDS